MEYNIEIISRNIKREREKLHYSQERLGKEINTSGKQISNYENGKTIPPIDVLFSLCKVFGCELGYLLGEESYSEGTQRLTTVSNYTRLSPEAIKQIVKITGQTKECVDFGYESERNRAVLNKFFNSKYFIKLIQAICELDDIYSEKDIEMEKVNSEMDIIMGKVDKGRHNIFFDHVDSHLDETCELSANELEALHQFETCIDKECSIEDRFQNNMRVSRFNIQELFTLLMNDLYKREK